MLIRFRTAHWVRAAALGRGLKVDLAAHPASESFKLWSRGHTS